MKHSEKEVWDKMRRLGVTKIRQVEERGDTKHRHDTFELLLSDAIIETLHSAGKLPRCVQHPHEFFRLHERSIRRSMPRKEVVGKQLQFDRNGRPKIVYDVLGMNDGHRLATKPVWGYVNKGDKARAEQCEEEVNELLVYEKDFYELLERINFGMANIPIDLKIDVGKEHATAQRRRSTTAEREELYPTIIEDIHSVYDTGRYTKEQTFEEVSRTSREKYDIYFSPGSLRGIFERAKEKFHEV